MAELSARAALQSTSLLVATRLVNLIMGLVSIPILIRYLTGTGFAAWALLLALAAGFALLELGLTQSAVRFATEPIRAGDAATARRMFGTVWLMLAASFGLAAAVVLQIAPQLAAWLRLPETEWLSASGAVVLVLAATGLRALLQSGTACLLATGRFKAVAGVSLAQPLAANLAAIFSAWYFRRLDVALVAYWAAQLAVLAAVFLHMRRFCRPSFSWECLNPPKMRLMWRFGIASQLDNAAQFASFQFDKLVISSWVGLWAVAPYEVANRAAAALRSLPASAAEFQLPSAMTFADNRPALWRWYLAASRMAAYGVAVFLLAPMAVAPVFLYAWTGEMGYVGRWTFAALALGALANVMALPAAALLQVVARPGHQVRAAVLVLLLNVPLSLLLVGIWGSAGAAIGTAVALTSGALALVYLAHQEFGMLMSITLARLARLWPLPVVALLWGLASFAGFEAWFGALEPASRFARANRAYPGLAAVLVYALCVLSMFLVEWWRGGITAEERRALTKWLWRR